MSNSRRGRTQEDGGGESPSSRRSRVGDAPTVRALKRVRFAADRVEDDAETPEATSASAPSSLPAEDATTNSLPAHSCKAVLPASAVEIPDQVMSEGASSAPDAAVRLSTKRSSDSSHSESETRRLHTDHSTRDVVTLLDDPDVSRAVERCREVCRRKETFLVDVNDWDSEFRDMLRACGSDGTTVACSSSGTTRELMSNESCLLDLLAAARNGNGNLHRKSSRSVRVNTNVVSWERLGIAKSSTQLWSIVPRWRRTTSWTRWESVMSFRDPMLRRKDAVSFAAGGSQSTRGPMTLLSYVLGGLPSVVVAVTNTRLSVSQSCDRTRSSVGRE